MHYYLCIYLPENPVGNFIHDNVELKTQINYLLILTKITSSQETNLLIKDIKFDGELYYYMLNFDIDYVKIFSRDQRLKACDYIYHKVLQTRQLVVNYPPYGKACRYGSKCKSLTNSRFKCKSLTNSRFKCSYIHPEYKNNIVSTAPEAIKFFG
jgi:hypothetical protein